MVILDGVFHGYVIRRSRVAAHPVALVENETDMSKDQLFLTSAMPNVMASVLGDIALDAGNPKRKKVGDSIDRGLVLRRLLEDNGFRLVWKRGRKKWHKTIPPQNSEFIKSICQ